jgi:hypothetical protein
MKYFYLLALSITTCLDALSQTTTAFSYSLSLPQHEMRNNIRPVHSLNINFMSHFKNMSNLSLGIEGGFGQYAAFTREQEIRLPDGSGFKADVRYSSNVASVGVLTRYQLFKDAKVNPFLMGKLGYANFFSSVVVDDPKDEDDCEPLERKTPISDHSFFVSYGAGLQIDISTRTNPQKTWINISLSQLHGTKLSYIDVKEIKHHDHDMNTDNSAATSNGKVPVNVTFINVSTQAIHKHQLATAHNSPLRLMEIKFAVMCRLNN